MPYTSLNLSYGVGDREAAVLANRQLLKTELEVEYLASARQVHGDRVFTVSTSITQDLEFKDCDALITNQPGIGLMIQQADCQAILLHDPVQGAIAAIHSGWQGSVRNIITKTITALIEGFGSRAKDIRAVISPSLGSCCGEFKNYAQELPVAFHCFQVNPNYFDFWAISRDQLQRVGITRENIEICAICTVCNRDFFSYRRAGREGNRITGRNGSMIMLPKNDLSADYADSAD